MLQALTSDFPVRTAAAEEIAQRWMRGEGQQRQFGEEALQSTSPLLQELNVAASKDATTEVLHDAAAWKARDEGRGEEFGHQLLEEDEILEAP